MRVAVIGAGPSGLVTLKYLLEAQESLGTEPVEARLFESEASVGGTFLARTYEDAELVSSRQLTTFSDFRVPHEPDFLSAERYLKYLHDYCSHFGLWPKINCSCVVKSVDRKPGEGYRLTYSARDGQHLWDCDAVAVCSGLHVTPNVPLIKGVENVPVRIHSSQFKKREQFGVGTTVLVLGSGETASDVGYLAVTSPTKRVVLCHRNGFHLAPKINPEPRIIGFSKRECSQPRIPIDVSRASLFDTAYVHPWLRNSMLLWHYYDMYVGWILWLSWGTTDGLDQWIGGKPPGWSTSQIFFNKSPKISPYINNAWKPKHPRSWLHYIQSFLVHTPTVDTHGRRIEIAPWPNFLDKDRRIIFRDNGRPEYHQMKDQVVQPDVIVYCTGYNQTFPFLKDQYAKPNVRDIWNRDEPSVGFIGFIRPSLGAIPPLAEMQAQLWVLNLLAPERVKIRRGFDVGGDDDDYDEESHYRLHPSKAARVQYGVDHDSYIFQLALDMDSAPSVSEVFGLAFRRRLWRLPLSWALSVNFNTKFRLRGPWRWKGAEEIMVGELWETVTRRPAFFGHFTLSFIPMVIFGPISLVTFIFAFLVGVIRRIFKL